MSKYLDILAATKRRCIGFNVFFIAKPFGRPSGNEESHRWK
jgi:hypothetical protein